MLEKYLYINNIRSCIVNVIIRCSRCLFLSLVARAIAAFSAVSNDSTAVSIMAIVPPRGVPAITGYVITPSSSWNGKDSRGRHAASNFVFLVGASGSPS